MALPKSGPPRPPFPLPKENDVHRKQERREEGGKERGVNLGSLR